MMNDYSMPIWKDMSNFEKIMTILEWVLAIVYVVPLAVYFNLLLSETSVIEFDEPNIIPDVKVLIPVKLLSAPLLAYEGVYHSGFLEEPPDISN